MLGNIEVTFFISLAKCNWKILNAKSRLGVQLITKSLFNLKADYPRPRKKINQFIKRLSTLATKRQRSNLQNRERQMRPLFANN